MATMAAATINEAAREIVGPDETAKREVWHIVADVKTTGSHYIFKAADILGRFLRATNTEAPGTAREVWRDTFVHGLDPVAINKWRAISGKYERRTLWEQQKVTKAHGG